MTSYDFYDGSGNWVGEMRSRDDVLIDRTLDRPDPTSLTWPARLLCAVVCITIIWSTWFVFRYAVTYLKESWGVSWAGPKRGVPYDGEYTGWGLLLLGFSLVYLFIEMYWVSSVGGAYRRGRRLGVFHVIGYYILILLLPVLFIYLALHSGSGWFFQPGWR